MHVSDALRERTDLVWYGNVTTQLSMDNPTELLYAALSKDLHGWQAELKKDMHQRR